MTPQRIQRKRTKGWRAPEGAVYVGRGTKWGNPFAVGKTQIRMPALNGGDWEHEGRLHKTSGQQNSFTHPHAKGEKPRVTWHQIEDATPEQCVTLYREYLAGEGEHLGWTIKRFPAELRDAIRTELRGKTLMCWCAEGAPCHGDVLLALASGKDV